MASWGPGPTSPWLPLHPMANTKMSIKPETYRKLTLAALVLLTTIVVTGAAVRLTGSGLGCEDWPTCENNKLIDDFDYHGWIENGNRLLTGVVSLAVAGAVLGSLFRKPRRSDLTWLSWGLVAGVVAQIILGAIVVRLELDPRIVLAHFLVSMVLVWNATVLHERAGLDGAALTARGERRAPAFVWAQSTLTVAAIGLGTIVTGSGPHTGSLDDPIDRLPYSVSDAARVHSVTALVLCAVALAIRFGPRLDPLARGRQSLVIAALAAQVGIGYLQYFTGVPVVLVGAHVLGASLLWIAVTRFHLVAGASAVAQAESPVPAPAGG